MNAHIFSFISTYFRGSYIPFLLSFHYTISIQKTNFSFNLNLETQTSLKKKQIDNLNLKKWLTM
jgi:hypothetical protein